MGEKAGKILGKILPFVGIKAGKILPFVGINGITVLQRRE
ncbi:hypothetical protein LTSEADE_2469 [Salmonella enterica subsp. enterica serovar Adelaide str. A4-669]|uniref:Uncharacterized protein n=1 Tax=Salmonella enterica subsp. enterica serovar Adelaide str. A4-669 TaxID=913063 RepID=A0A6C8GN80_SALET|nr:hypothetical protein LTSEADE_2469 [Salmonella enterica subsp. enterica serovar Adelaide str. A4-669]